MTTYLKEIDVASIQRAQSVKHYIKEVANGTSDIIIGEVAPILTCVTTRLNELYKQSASAEYFAGNGILASLGWNVLNSLLWNFRQRNAAVAIPVPSIDAFADVISSRIGNEEEIRMSTDNGFEAQERFDFSQEFCVGIYRQMYVDQRAAAGLVGAAAKYPPTAPEVILHGMQTNDNSKELSDAESELKAKQVAASPARLELMAASKVVKKSFDVHTARMHVVELNHVLTTISHIIPRKLDDDAWAQFPLAVQYKWTMSVFRQVIKAYGYEDMLEGDKRDELKLQALLDLAGEIRLELEAANRTTEIRSAFKNGGLTEKHMLLTASATAVVEQAAAPMQRAPRPDIAVDEDKLDELISKFGK